MKEMEKVYNPGAVEDEIYRAWEEEGCFHEEPDESREPFTIVIPPPNITGQLHMGHALDETLQDEIIRFQRMRGKCTLWLPGTDHASIATEVKIVDMLKEQGISKEDLGREGFLERAWEWKRQYGGRIVQQLRKLGSSCDWKRERFTLDEGCNRAVREVFVRLYEKGLIYRGNRLINWCPVCQTALSDAEVEYEEQASHLWHMKYPLKDGNGFIEVATTRPETMLGDTAVAVNPDDPRYTDLVGKTVLLPLADREIPIIADSYVEMDFGSGAVKITPAHDPNDYDMAQRHSLPIINILNEDGTLNDEVPEKYRGLSALKAREAVVDDMQALGLMDSIEDYAHNVGTCYRCHSTVEPLISRQWFVSMADLAKRANEGVHSGEVEFIPARYVSVYDSYMEHIRDWCISRQLWWGHRIPAWYCESCGKIHVLREDPTVCPDCGGKLHQDEDVLDTWFSSALWPFSTLGWPEETEDLKYFYPTQALVTGYDIIFFWVARMVFSGYEYTGKAPFSKVLIHGLVRDEQGRKMSKSLGNGIDPLEVIAQYGADALRFSLTMGTSPGNDMRYSTAKIEAARNFANKIWNASRFVLMGVGDDPLRNVNEVKLAPEDRWLLHRMSEVTKELTDHMESYELGMAAGKVYDFIWSEFCDWYIEWSKDRLYGDDAEGKEAARSVLVYALTVCLKLLHPFMPFLTEEIYGYLPGAEGRLIKAPWPNEVMEYSFPDDAARISAAMDLIRSIRNIRSEMKVPVGRKCRLLLSAEEDVCRFFEAQTAALRRMAAVSEVVPMSAGADAPKGAVSIVGQGFNAFLPMEDLVDLEAEKARLAKEKARLENEIARSETKLKNPGFTDKAPAAVVEKERMNCAANREKLAELLRHMEALEA